MYEKEWKIDPTSIPASRLEKWHENACLYSDRYLVLAYLIGRAINAQAANMKHGQVGEYIKKLPFSSAMAYNYRKLALKLDKKYGATVQSAISQGQEKSLSSVLGVRTTKKNQRAKKALLDDSCKDKPQTIRGTWRFFSSSLTPPTHTGRFLGGDIIIRLTELPYMSSSPACCDMTFQVRENDAPCGYMLVCLNHRIDGKTIAEVKRKAVQEACGLLKAHLDKHLLRCLSYLEKGASK